MATKADAPLPFHLQFAAGAIAGVTEILVMYPLDVVKVNYLLRRSEFWAECTDISARLDFNYRSRARANSTKA